MTFAPDTRVYLAISEHILSTNALGREFLFWIGPGYGLILAGVESLFGSNHLYACGLNMLLGSLAAVAVYLLAYQLTDSKSVALIAGLIAALSPTSLSLSCNILTDQPYYTFHAFALLLYTLGLSTSKGRWFVAAGLMAGCAAYIRALGQLWPLAFFLIPILLPSRDRTLSKSRLSRMAMAKKVALTSGIALIMILGWATRNYVTEGVFVFGGNGPIAARWYVAARAVVNSTNETDITQVQRQWSEEDQLYYSDRTPTTAQKYTRFKDQFMQFASEHPRWVVKAFFQNVAENMKSANYFARDQVPVLSSLWWTLIVATERWSSHAIAVISLIGLMIMVFHRRYYAALLLGGGFVYVTLVIGFSLWQGSRLHYPAEISWSILLAYTICHAARTLTGFWRRRPALPNIAGEIARFLRIRFPSGN
ncbi:MAG: glycosyltransferase family 39 protein [candidate division Zixibacteria bacterium]|nr:glycosyltransferase family 39 protein [candidate division Zixibacteria bacterium]